MKPAPNLALVGPMGAGKTSVARMLAPLLGLRFADTDLDIEHAAGLAVAALFERDGEAGFRRLEREALARRLAGHGQVLATGGGAVLDPDNRALLRARAFVVHLHASPAEQSARLQGDHSRPLLQGLDTTARLEALAAARDPLYAAVADLHLDTGGTPPAEVTRQLMAGLEGRWHPGETA